MIIYIIISCNNTMLNFKSTLAILGVIFSTCLGAGLDIATSVEAFQVNSDRSNNQFGSTSSPLSLIADPKCGSYSSALIEKV